MKGPFHHPLDNLINDDKLFLLETMIPFVDERMKAPLAMYIKVVELQLILKGFRNHSYVNQCGLCRNINNQDDVLEALAGCGFGDIAGQMNQFKSMMNMMNVMNMMEENGTHAGHSDSFSHAGHSGNMNKRFQDIFDEYDGNEEYDRNAQLDRHDQFDKFDYQENYDTYSMYEKYSDRSKIDRQEEYRQTPAKNDSMLDNIMNLLDEYDHSHQ